MSDSDFADADWSVISRRLKAVGEAITLALVALSPWPFASAEPTWEFAVVAGAGLVVLLWAADAFLTRRLIVRPDVVLFGLGGLLLVAVLQLVPLPESVVAVLSPTAADLHRTLIPATAEVLPGEPSPGTPRAAWQPITVDAYLTKTYVGQLTAVLLLYAAVRNWLASRGAFKRLAWTATLTGAAIAGLAMAQAATSSPQDVYWSVTTGGNVFGPFVCKNHFPDFVNLCLGLGLGLGWQPTSRSDPKRQLSLPDTDSVGTRLMDAVSTALQSPRGFALIAVLGTMAAAIPFSLSRGGVLATVAAAAVTAVIAIKGGRPGGLLAVGVLAVALAVGSFFGWGTIETKVGESDTRRGLWKDALLLVPQYPFTGAGANTFGRVEPIVRTSTTDPNLEYDTAHNEYLDALVEGGPVRLAFTLALAVGLPLLLAHGYRQRADRASGPLILGAFFGLTALAVHSVADFGIRIAAVTAIAAVVAGHAVAAASDGRYERARVRKRKGDNVSESREKVERRTTPLTGSVAVFAAGGLVLIAGFTTWTAYLRGEAYTHGRAADVLAKDPLLSAERVEEAEARVAAAPDDVVALGQLASAHFDAARADGKTLLAVVIGGPVAGGADVVPVGVLNTRVVPGVAAARAARTAGPLDGRPHMRLGQYARFVAVGEPPGAHFARAAKLRPGDSDVWFAVGREAMRRGDTTAARDAWSRSLTLNPGQLAAVLRAAGPGVNVADLVPKNPAVVLTAANLLYPDRIRDRDQRRPLLEAALVDPVGQDVPGLIALATVCGELGRPDLAEGAWRRAVEVEPFEVRTRLGYADWLTADERYAEAIDQLDHLPDAGDIPPVWAVRAAAKHAMALQADIGGGR